MSRHALFAGAALVAAFAFAPTASAQPLTGPSCTVGSNCVHTLSGTVPVLVNLTLESPSTAIGAVTAAQFDNGQLLDGPRFEVRANRGYNVTLTAAAATFSGGGNNAKAASDVRWVRVTDAAGCAGATGFAALSNTTAATIFTGSAGLSPRQRLCFNIAWNYGTDGPGAYTLPLNLTVAAP
jgi:hypothetical protein